MKFAIRVYVEGIFSASRRNRKQSARCLHRSWNLATASSRQTTGLILGLSATTSYKMLAMYLSEQRGRKMVCRKSLVLVFLFKVLVR
jgi:hypothetical protein